MSWIELLGTDGTLLLPDPNGYDGIVRRRGRELERPLGDDGHRGGDVSDAVSASSRWRGPSAAARPPRASGEHTFHVLDTLLAILESADAGVVTEIGSRCERPAPLTDPVAVG